MSCIDVSAPPPFPDAELDKPLTNRGLMVALNNHAAEMRRIVEGQKPATEPADLISNVILLRRSLQRIAEAIEAAVDGPGVYGKDGAAE